MIVLDTNVVSEAMKPEPNPTLRDWLDEQVAETLYISSVTVAELLFDIVAMPEGRRKQKLTTTLDGMVPLLEGRILAFDTNAARRYADLAIAARKAGKGFPHAGRLYRRYRSRPWFRGGDTRCQRLQRGRRPRNRPLDGTALNIRTLRL